MSFDEPLLRSLLVETKDGEWGKDEPFADSIEMSVVRGTDFEAVSNGRLDSVPVRYIAAKAAQRKTLAPKDILIETAGGSKGKPTGRTVFLRSGLFDGAVRPLTCASFARFLRVDDRLANPEYVYWCLQSLYKSGQIEPYQVQHTGIARFQFTKFADSQSIPLPKRGDQDSVVEVLGALDRRITLLRETNATLEAIAQALFKSWFVDFDPVRAKRDGRAPEGMDDATAALFPDSFEDSELGEVPRGWRVMPIAEAYELNPTRKLSKGAPAPYLDMANVPTKGFGAADVAMREFGSGTKFICGDTLLARITPCLENGKSAFVDFLRDGQVGWGSTEFVVLRPKPPLPVFHAYLLCRHQPFREHAVQSLSGTSGRQRIQNDVLGRYMLAVPSEHVAMAFGETVAVIQRKATANNALGRTLATLRDTLLPRLISGQLRLPATEPGPHQAASQNAPLPAAARQGALHAD